MPQSYQEILDAGYQADRDFCIATDHLDNIDTCLLVAPHGGSIEPGMGDTMLAVAEEGQWAYYLFEGRLSRRNWARLHIPSTSFDEPTLLRLLPRTRFVLSFHGESGGRRRIIYVGGLYRQGREILVAGLNHDLAELGIAALDAMEAGAEEIAGRSQRNITNHGTLRAGVQLEFSQGVRTLLFRNLNQSRRRQPTEHLGVLARSIDRALARLTGGR